ncbi:MAG TPA: transglycosylase SLT domain-containing protein [Pseudobdellovibrionaceae bacterium]|nr:transglycosylase SLT domain-containing protein [Pseudobdellovibrionaceae bacterium]
MQSAPHFKLSWNLSNRETHQQVSMGLSVGESVGFSVVGVSGVRFSITQRVMKLALIAALTCGQFSAAQASSSASLTQLRPIGQAVRAGDLARAMDAAKRAGDEPAARLALAIQHQSRGEWSEADAVLAQLLENPQRVNGLQHQARLARAEGLIELKKPLEARPLLASIVNISQKNLLAEVPTALRVRAIVLLARVEAGQARWREVERITATALRRVRGGEAYPALAYEALRAKRHLGKSDCRLARALYAKYPAAPEVEKWGPLMPENRVDDLALACSNTAKDMQDRFRRLQLSGQVDRSLAEIRKIRELGVFAAWSTDAFEINALLAKGESDAAMEILARHADTHRGHTGFWMLTGKIASRMGELALSAGAYRRAYEIAPKARSASDALFSAAFTAYQMQDYDGAERDFEKLATRYGRAKVARDARWHLAWMSYLRGDYERALSRWQALLKERSRGRRRVAATDATSPDRISYWSAMALLRLGRSPEAIEILRRLASDRNISYYAILAWYRLKSLPQAPRVDLAGQMSSDPRQDVAVVADEESTEAAEAETESEAEAALSEAAVEAAPDVAVDTGGALESKAVNGNGEAATLDTNAEASVEVSMDEPAADPSVRDPGLQRHLDRVRMLHAVGLDSRVRWELENLDRRVRNSADRRVMMAELFRLGRYDRASQLAELAFGGERVRGGLEKARELWEYAYPRAWNEVVERESRNSGIDPLFVWSIMRAESQYRFDARSPVGATGLMQLMPFTAQQVARVYMGRSMDGMNLTDPATNIELGARYLRRLAEKTGGSLPLMAAAYNAGPHRAQIWLRGFGSLGMDEFIEHIPFAETRNYVKKVSRHYKIYLALYEGDRGSLTWLTGPVGVRPDVSSTALEVW